MDDQHRRRGAICCLDRLQSMEPLWSPVVATGGNRSQIEQAQEPPRQAETVAVGCDRLPKGAHGKEGVDGSSPSEGSARAPQNGASSLRSTCTIHSVRWVWSPLWSLQIERRLRQGQKTTQLPVQR